MASQTCRIIVHGMVQDVETYLWAGNVLRLYNSTRLLNQTGLGMKQREVSRISAFDAKTHLSQLLRQAEQGRPITITRHGKPVARLVPIDKSSSMGAGDLIRAFRRVRQTIGKPLKIKHMIREGRKY